jgi:hypothetical protein
MNNLANGYELTLFEASMRMIPVIPGDKYSEKVEYSTIFEFITCACIKNLFA